MAGPAREAEASYTTPLHYPNPGVLLAGAALRNGSTRFVQRCKTLKAAKLFIVSLVTERLTRETSLCWLTCLISLEPLGQEQL